MIVSCFFVAQGQENHALRDYRIKWNPCNLQNLEILKIDIFVGFWVRFKISNLSIQNSMRLESIKHLATINGNLWPSCIWDENNL